MQIDEKAFEAAWHDYMHNGIVAGESDCLRRAIEAYETAKVAQQPDDCRKAFEAALSEGNFTPEDEYNNFHLDEGNLYWLWGKAWQAAWNTCPQPAAPSLVSVYFKCGAGGRAVLQGGRYYLDGKCNGCSRSREPATLTDDEYHELVGIMASEIAVASLGQPFESAIAEATAALDALLERFELRRMV